MVKKIKKKEQVQGRSSDTIYCTEKESHSFTYNPYVFGMITQKHLHHGSLLELPSFKIKSDCIIVFVKTLPKLSKYAGRVCY